MATPDPDIFTGEERAELVQFALAGGPCRLVSKLERCDECGRLKYLHQQTRCEYHHQMSYWLFLIKQAEEPNAAWTKR